MRAKFNIKIDNKIYGVLVSQSKTHRTYRKAKSPFKTETANLSDELHQAFDDKPELKERFLTGKSIQL